MTTETYAVRVRDKRTGLTSSPVDVAFNLAAVGPKRTLAGAATADAATWTSHTAAQPGGVGPLPMRRTFDAFNSGPVGPNGIPINVAQARCYPDVAAGRISVHSNKPGNLATCAAGGYDAQLDAFYASINHEYIGIINHEPEDEVAGGTFTAANWRAANVRCAQRMKALGKPNLKFAICLRGFRTVYSYGGLEQFWDPQFAGLVDYILFDPYKDAGPNIPTTYAAYMQSSMDWARSKGKTVGIAEWGISRNFTDAQRASWIEECWEWAKAQPDVAFSIYWHSLIAGGGTGADFTVPPATYPLAHAQMREMATEGQRP